MTHLTTLISDIPALNKQLQNCIRWWEPDSPPSTIAYGEIGRAIGEHLAEIPGKEQVRIFADIETSMASSNEDLAVAVATGLFEALLTQADKNPKLWTELGKLFGAASARYAMAWRERGRYGSQDYPGS